MKDEQLLDAIGQLPEELLAETDKLRRRKRSTGWISLAACLCLMAGLSLFARPMFSADSKFAAPEADAAHRYWDCNLGSPEYGFSAMAPEIENSASIPISSFTATVREVHNGYLIVEPFPEESEARSGERFFIGIPEDCELTFREGDTVEIFHNGVLMEVSPVQLGKIYSIHIITP